MIYASSSAITIGICFGVQRLKASLKLRINLEAIKAFFAITSSRCITTLSRIYFPLPSRLNFSLGLAIKSIFKCAGSQKAFDSELHMFSRAEQSRTSWGSVGVRTISKGGISRISRTNWRFRFPRFLFCYLLQLASSRCLHRSWINTNWYYIFSHGLCFNFPFAQLRRTIANILHHIKPAIRIKHRARGDETMNGSGEHQRSMQIMPNLKTQKRNLLVCQWFFPPLSSTLASLTSAHKFIIVVESRVGRFSMCTTIRTSKAWNISSWRQSHGLVICDAMGEITFRDEIICNHKIYVPPGMIEVVGAKGFPCLIYMHFCIPYDALFGVGARNWLGF